MNFIGFMEAVEVIVPIYQRRIRSAKSLECGVGEAW